MGMLAVDPRMVPLSQLHNSIASCQDRIFGSAAIIIFMLRCGHPLSKGQKRSLKGVLFRWKIQACDYLQQLHAFAPNESSACLLNAGDRGTCDFVYHQTNCNSSS